jgi:spermidine synthase
MNASIAVSKRPYVDLFLISFNILFLELACIRWFGSTVVFLTFFTNVVLLATFLGMSVGCLAASARRNWAAAVVPLILIAAVLAWGTLYIYNHYGRVMVDVGGQGSPQQVYFGTEYRARDVAGFVVPIELLAGIFFTLISLSFVGLGQIMGRAFNEAPDRLRAYISNIGGSLAGIAVFALASYWRTTPLTWFAIVMLIWAYFLKDHLKNPSPLQVQSMLGLMCLMGFVSYNSSIWSPYQKSPAYGAMLWSPYYKIYTVSGRDIVTNNIGHQDMVDIKQSGPGYALPHLLNRDAGAKPFEDVLIIGAGSGNDVAAALAHGVRHVDAVEIDPSINDIGRAQHPSHPYQDPRVTVHINDGRSFIRTTTKQYDLVVYALVDSLVLHSGYSNLRLESFLFTEEAFADVRARLKPNGMFAVYNFFRQGWIVARIAKMAENVFVTRPVIMSLPYVDSIRPADSEANRITFLIAGNKESPLETISQKFAQQGSYWVHNRPAMNDGVNGFGAQPPVTADAEQSQWNRFKPAVVDTAGTVRLPKDDWPFLYLRDAMIPGLNIRSILLIAGLSFAIFFGVSPVRSFRPNWQMFLLGAAFMLLETKGVVHMALLFGSTWIVNSVVFFAILVMIMCSNLYVLAFRPRNLWPYYALLVASLTVNIAVPMSTFLALPGAEKIAVSCAVIFVPIFFAGIVFGASFRDSTQPDLDFGSNIAGAILGGLIEALSLVTGFNLLLVVAVAFYVLSAVVKKAPVPLRVAVPG